VSRGKRRESEDDRVPAILEADKSSKEYRKNWARLIQNIYEVDPPTCPKCQGTIPSLKQIVSGAARYVLDYFCQLSLNDDYLHRDPDYSWEAYLQS
jgi:hypothetical protein